MKLRTAGFIIFVVLVVPVRWAMNLASSAFVKSGSAYFAGNNCGCRCGGTGGGNGPRVGV